MANSPQMLAGIAFVSADGVPYLGAGDFTYTPPV